MYDELIRSCRACATGYEGNCDNCMFSGEDCYKQLHKASAEAIEAQDRHILTLQHEMMAEAESHNALVERLNKQIEVLSKTENTTHWIPVTKRLPEDNEAVNVVWVNHSPVFYYQHIKDKPQTATGVYYKGKWYWWSAVTQDYLAEYGKWEPDLMDAAIEVTHWMPLPETPKEE